MRRVLGGQSRLAGIAGLALVGTAAIASGCKTNPMAKIDAVRDALEKDDAAAIASATEGYAACSDGPPLVLLPKQMSPRDTGCFGAIAAGLGSKQGFRAMPPDQAAAATIAVVMTRDGRGDWVGHSDDWLAVLKNGKGAGFDALRLAVARRMADAAPAIGRSLETDVDADAAMKAVAGAIPGACATYWLIGSGSDPTRLAADVSADHAACVHHDLGRREGPGSSYGTGRFRALEGSLALWRETERALRLGLSASTPAAKATIEKKLAVVEPATQAIATKKVASATPAAAVMALGDMHLDAGIVLWKDAGADAGADGGLDAGAAHQPPPLKRPF